MTLWLEGNGHEMRSLVQWRDPEVEVRVSIAKWLYKEPLGEQFIEHPRNPWLLWNYVWKVGIRAVFNKIRSRLAESGRNNRIVGLGVGYVLEAPAGLSVSVRQPVVFFAPNHNVNAKTAVIDKAFVAQIPNDRSRPVYAATPVIPGLPEALLRYRAWSRYSGAPLDALCLRTSLEEIANDYGSHLSEQLGLSETLIDNYEVTVAQVSKPTAVLFGLGNYAKTAILPNIERHFSLQRIHEIDPEQLRYLGDKVAISLDTSPLPRGNQRFDAWFIAGFHHMHSELAIEAIEQGAAAVIEKPLATTRLQYEDFLNALSRHPEHQFFLCFHKRYSELNEHFRSDTGSKRGDPVDMHCIVYEIPLPQYHWYNWPSSGSRLISNGCHWLDYFMFVNDYPDVVDYRKWQPRGADVVVQVKLDNGAYFSMILTDTGSQRLGVRDYTEMRLGGITITMTDGSQYSAENRNRVFRRAKVNPLNAYARMYKKISREVSRGGQGDDIKSLRSSNLTLLLEEL